MENELEQELDQELDQKLDHEQEQELNQKLDHEQGQERRLHFHMKLRLYYEERNFGPGVSALMQLVKERGSLSAACQEMHMAYSKAWKIIQKAEKDLGFPLMEGKRGGEHGGATVLTGQGDAFLKKYLQFAAEAEKAVGELFEKYYPEETENGEDGEGQPPI